MSTTHIRDVYTIAEVARRLRVSRDTVRRACERGDIPAVKISSQWRIKAQPFDAMLGESEQPEHLRSIATKRSA